MEKQLEISNEINHTIYEFLDELIHSIKTDKLQLETGTMHPTKKEFLQGFVTGNLDQTFKELNSAANDYYWKKITVDFITQATMSDCDFQSLAIKYSSNKVMVWAVINDDDEKTEDCLIMMQANINSKYNGYGLSIAVVEKSDNFATPPHYKNLPLLKITD